MGSWGWDQGTFRALHTVGDSVQKQAALLPSRGKPSSKIRCFYTAACPLHLVVRVASGKLCRSACLHCTTHLPLQQRPRGHQVAWWLAGVLQRLVSEELRHKLQQHTTAAEEGRAIKAGNMRAHVSGKGKEAAGSRVVGAQAGAQ